jgi:TrmH family RNA methyltransferase
MITSSRNPNVKYVKRLLLSRRFRQNENGYVVEGDRWLDEIIKKNVSPHQLYISGRWYESDGNQERLTKMAAPWKLVSDMVMAHMSDTVSPPGILTVLPMERLPIPDNPTLILILDRVANPGNLGAMLRTAAAAGVDAVLLAPGCVDPHNPKVVRSSMGAILNLPISRRGWPEIEADVSHMAVWLAVTSGNTRHAQVDWRQPSALIVGSEASGAGADAQRLAKSVSIPMVQGSESLNVAVAAGIILFEATRQRSETINL